MENYVTRITQAIGSIQFLLPVTDLFLPSIRETIAYATRPPKFDFGGALFVPRFSENK
jgi:hypothetical protein